MDNLQKQLLQLKHAGCCGIKISYEDEGAGAGIVVGGAAGVGSGGAAGVVLEGAVAGAAIIGEAGKEPIYYLGGGEQGTSYFIDDDENSPDAGVYSWRRSSKYLAGNRSVGSSRCK